MERNSCWQMFWACITVPNNSARNHAPAENSQTHCMAARCQQAENTPLMHVSKRA